jgi:hypothetical protein
MSVFTSRRNHAILAAATAATACALLGPATSAPAAIVFDQDFSSSNTLADYVSATPNSGQFNDISTEGELATVSVANGALVFDMSPDTNGSTAPNPDTGLLRSTDLATPVPGLLNVEMTLTYSRDDTTSNFGPGPSLQIGDFASTATNYGSSVTADRFDEIGFRRNGLTSYWVELSTTDRVAATFGSEATLSYFLNDSGAAADFLGPDNVTRSLDNDTVALFVGNTLVATNHAATNGSSSDLSSFRFIAHDGSDTSLQISRITVRDDFGVVPEPASAGLLALGAGAMLLGRRRRHANTTGDRA